MLHKDFFFMCDVLPLKTRATRVGRDRFSETDLFDLGKLRVGGGLLLRIWLREIGFVDWESRYCISSISLMIPHIDTAAF